MHSFYEKHFELLNSDNPLVKGEYEACTFEDCTFTRADLSECKFIECTFTNCDLSNAKIQKTMFQEVNFDQCKLLGLLFTDCNTFGFGIKCNESILSESTFYDLNLTQCTFTFCILHYTDFVSAKAQNVLFNQSDLKGATFENTQLQKADFTQAINYSINPNTNQLKGAKFSLPEVIGLLDQYELSITK